MPLITACSSGGRASIVCNRLPCCVFPLNQRRHHGYSLRAKPYSSPFRVFQSTNTTCILASTFCCVRFSLCSNMNDLRLANLSIGGSVTRTPLEFMDLPKEIRMMIYRYALRRRSVKNSVPALLSVNRQIREEASPTFYRINRFLLNLQPQPTTRSIVHDFDEKLANGSLSSVLSTSTTCVTLHSLSPAPKSTTTNTTNTTSICRAVTLANGDS